MGAVDDEVGLHAAVPPLTIHLVSPRLACGLVVARSGPNKGGTPLVGDAHKKWPSQATNLRAYWQQNLHAEVAAFAEMFQVGGRSLGLLLQEVKRAG